MNDSLQHYIDSIRYTSQIQNLTFQMNQVQTTNHEFIEGFKSMLWWFISIVIALQVINWVRQHQIQKRELENVKEEIRKEMTDEIRKKLPVDAIKSIITNNSHLNQIDRRISIIDLELYSLSVDKILLTEESSEKLEQKIKLLQLSTEVLEKTGMYEYIVDRCLNEVIAQLNRIENKYFSITINKSDLITFFRSNVFNSFEEKRDKAIELIKNKIES